MWAIEANGVHVGREEDPSGGQQLAIGMYDDRKGCGWRRGVY